MVRYPWYELIDGDTFPLQGDFISDCPIIVPNKEITGIIDATKRLYNVIIMSQSCDLENKKLDLVLVCPYWPLSEFAKYDSYYNSSGGKEGLRRGYFPGYHLLNKCDIEGFETDYLIVDFRNVYGVQFDFLIEFINEQNKRLRLLPPYREHLSQAFARFFMRVGLPIDIPEFKKKIN